MTATKEKIAVVGGRMTYKEVLDYWETKIPARSGKTLWLMIAKAIEKQIPKPKHKYTGYRCICGNEVAKNQDYCECCGQRLLEWEDPEVK